MDKRVFLLSMGNKKTGRLPGFFIMNRLMRIYLIASAIVFPMSAGLATT